ncbi:hypothetical protein SKTS_32950 [Sulfurimicrobium lacus]|uniref:Lysis protein n=1 Tax=Sulfurimicrobium lacus TaxID=2715678 RepID=A0A6F8VI73_9PROT|nr:lysis system i-spanin subunit Rz [Sulfurimicrobium lacus]BCB28409.1 hypothetical protein SKTS_32950 [Sulfurimicrobium lacus]
MNISVIPPWVKWLAAVALIAAVVAAFYAYGQQQFGLGMTSERATWLARENGALTKANGRIKELEEQARTREHEHAQDMAVASAKYQEDLKHEKAAKDRVIADLRRGDLRLRIPVTCPVPAAGDRTAALGTGPAGRDGETRAELSVEASEFLVGLASEADEVVHQLTACQAVVNADRKQPGEKQ